MREMHLKSEIAQLELNDLWCGKHTCMPHTKAYNPFFDIRFFNRSRAVWLWRNLAISLRLYALREGGSPTHGGYNT